MQNDSDKLKKVSSFSKEDADAMTNMFTEVTEKVQEDNEISDDTIALLDRVILELLQMRKRHVIIYMSLLKRGYTE